MRRTAAQGPLAGLNLVSYNRISDDTQGDAHGVKDQRATNRRHARMLGAEIVREFEDNDLSASNAAVYRSDFEALVKALLLGHLDDGTKVDGVIVVEQSRIARTQTDWERYAEALVMADGRVHVEGLSILDPYSDAFDLHGTFGTYTNKTESKKIKVRTKRSHRRRALAGIPVGGRPFGWRDDKLTLDPVEAEAARKAVRGFLEGRTLHRLVMDLQNAGFTSVKGNPWTMDALRKYLSNPRLCGYRIVDGELVRDDDGNIVIGQWEPLISVEEWEAVQAIFASRRGTRMMPSTTVPKHLLSGLVRCGKCTGRMRGVTRKETTKSKGVRETRMYVCPSKSVGGCGGLGRHAERVEFYVVESILERLRSRLDTGPREEQTWEGEVALSEAETRREFLNNAWMSKRMSDETYLSQLEAVEATIKTLRRERDADDRRKAKANTLPTDLMGEWERRATDIEWKRLVLAEHIRAVILKPVGKGQRAVNGDNTVILWRD